MQEIISEAIVLEIEDLGEFDSRVYFFTKDFGKVVAKATSFRKVTSKLAGHLQPLNLVTVRLLSRQDNPFGLSGFHCLDALSINKPISRMKSEDHRGLLAAMRLVAYSVPELTPDQEIWNSILSSLNGADNLNVRDILRILGFDQAYASCSVCKDPQAKFFYGPEQSFLCQNCSRLNNLLSHKKLIKL